jgi:hypothetical protein
MPPARRENLQVPRHEADARAFAVAGRPARRGRTRWHKIVPTTAHQTPGKCSRELLEDGGDRHDRIASSSA